jgi:hypothetical protein
MDVQPIDAPLAVRAKRVGRHELDEGEVERPDHADQQEDAVGRYQGLERNLIARSKTSAISKAPRRRAAGMIPSIRGLIAAGGSFIE